jgi:hypothetical protein
MRSNDRHPAESDIALFAGGDCGRWQTFRLKRHLANCDDCRDALACYSDLRLAVSDQAENGFAPADWNRLAAEMRANIRVGLAAGECVREKPGKPSPREWTPRWAIATACVLLLAGAGIFLRGLLPHEAAPATARMAVVQSTGAGVEVSTGKGSMTLLNHGDDAGDQTVTSEGAIRASYVDGNTGTVTVTSVYVE